MNRSTPSAKHQRFLYETLVVVEHPRAAIERHAVEGWQLVHLVPGGFDVGDRWLDCALTLVFEREVVAANGTKTATG